MRLANLDVRLRPRFTVPLRSGIGVAGVITLLTTGPALYAQRPVEIRGEPSCRTCRIALDPVAVLHDRSAPGAVGHTRTVARDSRGRFYVVSQQTRSRIAAFDSTGAFLTWIGNPGEGPGEYRVITRIDVLRGDTLAVFDARTLRQTILSPDYRVVMSERFERSVTMTNAVRIDRNRLLTSGNISTPENLGYPLHLLDSTGRVVRSFGTDVPLARPDMPYYNNRVLTRDRAGRLWTAHATAYYLELWDTGGRKLRELRRIVPWFEPWTRQVPFSPETPPPHFVYALRVDSADRLWVILNVPDEQWAEGLRSETTSSGTSWTIADPERAYDFVIEVIDLSTGRLLASHRSDYLITSFIPDTDFVFAYREDEGGNPSLHVWRVRLANSREEQ